MLLVTRESLRGDRNEGSVLLNLFEGLPVELANICCKSEPPDNDLCRGRYYCMTDRMAAKKILHGTPMGKNLLPEESQTEKASGKGNNPFYDFFRKHNWNIFYLAQDLLWGMAGFQSAGLDAFIDAFKPDVIFAPLTPYWYANRLQGHVIERANVPAVTYLYDDIYSLKQYSFSPFYWLHRFIVRGSIRRNLPLYRYAYTMTEQQKREYERMLDLPMRVLRKSASPGRPERQPHRGMRLIYAGGVYYGRDKTLALVADAVRALRAEGHDLRLDIYTPSPIKKGMERRLNDGAASILHSTIPAGELEKQYAQSDIALHVESFRKKDALTTRLSFSTKIVDCLASGCAVLAICPKINAGWQYLRDEGAALCLCDVKQIRQALRQITAGTEYREKLAAAAAECLLRNHGAGRIKCELMDELTGLTKA